MFGQSHNTIRRPGLRGRGLPVLLVVLVLSGGALVLAAGEARAQQQAPKPEPRPHAAVPGAERAAGTGGDELAVRLRKADPLPPRTGEREDATPVPRGTVTPGSPEPALTLLERFVPAFESGLVAGAQPASGPAVTFMDPDYAWEPEEEPEPAPGTPAPAFLDVLPPDSGAADLWSVPPDPGLLPGPAFDQEAAPEKYGLFSARVGEGSPALSPEGGRPEPLPGQVPGGVVAPGEPPFPVVGQGPAPTAVPAVPEHPSPAAAVPEPQREAPGLLPGLEAAADSAVGTIQSAAGVADAAVAGVSGAVMGPVGEALSGGSTPAGAQETPEDTPPPPPPPSPSPFGGSSYSLLGMGLAGVGGVAPLFMCILAAGVILLRPASRLSWASCELPKPSSVLLMPLERPG